MKWPVLFVVLVIGLVCCSEENAGDGCVPTSKALEKISSLSNIVKSGRVAGRPSCTVYKGAQIFSCQYKGETTYYFTNWPSSNSLCSSIVYNCHGDEILNWGSDQAGWTTFETGRTEVEELWRKP